MAFPTTGILDNFNRTEDPLSDSGNWTMDVPTGDADFSTNGTQALDNSTPASGWRSDQTYGADSEVYALLDTATTDGFRTLWIRGSDFGTTGEDGYAIGIEKKTGSDQFFVDEVTNGTFDTISTVTDAEFVNGDSIGGEAIGTTIRMMWKTSGSWTEKRSIADELHQGAGNIGMAVTAATNIDEFGGGTVVAAGTGFNIHLSLLGVGA